ncbi:MAG: FAD-dependent oxidoreductase [Oscillospiraceae bacterium]|nr:FAD-dependent oxidoreductase [Oscillospiraceae bacterium]
MSKTYLEAANTLPVYDECDVLVVGGGAAGHSAAVAAARANPNASVIVMERYGYFGGDVTGAYVLLLPALNWRTYPLIGGIMEEWFTRLDKNAPDSYVGAPWKYVGRGDVPYMIKKYEMYEGLVNEREEPHTLNRNMFFEPTAIKLEMDAMVQECKNIKSLLHCWGTKPIVEDGKVKGVIFESKAGRQVVYAKIVIDATGDGDLFSQCAEYHGESGGHIDYDHRDGQTALVWRVGGVNYEPFARMRLDEPKVFRRYIEDLWEVAGYKTIFFPTGVDGVVWFNNWLLHKSCINLDDLRETEFMVRNSIRRILAFCKETLPQCFKDAWLYDIAPQAGVRLSRRLDGVKFMTPLDFALNTEFDDVIGWTRGRAAPIEIPYSCLVPKKVDNLICPGRHLSADPLAIGALQLIAQCVQTGQAAGVAAAVAAMDNSTAKTVDIKKVQTILSQEQGVILPRQPNTNKAMVEELEAINYGRDSEFSRNVRKKAGLDW